MKILIKYYKPAILWALFIFIMCTINLGKAGDSPIFFKGFDKLVHCGFFFVLVTFCCQGLIRQQSTLLLSYKHVLLFTLMATVFGGIIELLQAYVFTWRTGDWNDLFADTVGASMGAFGIIITLMAISYAKK